MMTSFYNLLKYAATGIASPDMTYYDRMRASMLMGGGAVQTLTGIPPLSFNSNGTPLISWSIKGNGQQTGTPTPDNPVMPEFVGTKTANLSPPLSAWVDGYVSAYTGDILSPTQTEEKTSPYIDISGITGYLYMSYETGMFPVGNNGDWWCIGFYTDGKTFISRLASANYKHFLIPDNARYVRISFRTYGYTDNCMLSHGYDPVDYEPYGWKVLFENHGENLLNKTEFTGVSATIEQVDNGIQVITENGGYAARIILDVQENTDYTLSYIWKKISGAASNVIKVFAGTGSSTEIATFSNSTGGTFNTGDNTKINIWFYAAFGAKATVEYTNIMLNLGSTPKPYSPYLNETLPVYLGEVPTVRRIKKLVLTGEENFGKYSQGDDDWLYYNALGSANRAAVTTVICTHAGYQSYTSQGSNPYARISDTKSSLLLNLGTAIGNNNVESFKAYLAAQYAAGTPVVIWYVLANEQTGIVNEPLAKIGDYADELHSTDAGVTIPTVKGSNTLTVETELQPSEMSITYKG